MSPSHAGEELRHNLVLIAPGTELRDGLDRILRGRTGGLITLGTNEIVADISTGGFHLDVPYSPTALRELAKMDGAIVYDPTRHRIIAAGVHLMPDPSLPTNETGTRHRTADRVSQHSRVPVLSLSASMATITLYLNGVRHVLDTTEHILARADQALQTMTRYRERLITLINRLSTLEVEEQVTVRDFALVAQRIELMRRLDLEVDTYVVELGKHGRLLALQQHELFGGLEELADLLADDYRPAAMSAEDFALPRLAVLDDEALLDPLAVARNVGFASDQHMDTKITARGLRQLAQIRLPAGFSQRLLDHFGGLQPLFAASIGELLSVEGVGDGRAKLIRDGLTRLAESAVTDRGETSKSFSS